MESKVNLFQKKIISLVTNSKKLKMEIENLKFAIIKAFS